MVVSFYTCYLICYDYVVVFGDRGIDVTSSRMLCSHNQGTRAPSEAVVTTPGHRSCVPLAIEGDLLLNKVRSAPCTK